MQVKTYFFDRSKDFSREESFWDVKKELNLNKIYWMKQTHGCNLEIIKNQKEGEIKNVDAIITKEKNTGLVSKSADCQSVLIYDPKKEVIAAVHLGWRNLAKKFIKKVIQTLLKRFDCSPENLTFKVSPSLGSCCSFFSDPKKELPRFMHKYILEGNRVNLWECLNDLIISCGVKKENIENKEICTMCKNNKYFSHRKGYKGRNGSLVMIN